MAQTSPPNHNDQQHDVPEKQAPENLSAESGAAGSDIDWPTQIEHLRGLARIVQQENLSELSVESAGVRLTLKTTVPPAPGVHLAHPGFHAAAPVTPMSTVEAADASSAATGPPASAGAGTAEAEPAEDLVPVVAPMVGVFYRAPSPNDPYFVEVGDRVEVGQTIGLIEAMKVFNEIISEVEGTVADIFVENAELVETGATLM
ncbi:MAG: hypothetical protein M3347_17050, partial [Armatimonadota bacterium]|nr:hypothetical protein [Armatimonadota bacterium]